MISPLFSNSISSEFQQRSPFRVPSAYADLLPVLESHGQASDVIVTKGVEGLCGGPVSLEIPAVSLIMRH
jgi:hypothetical protein